jgi:hypothetical protein
VAGAFRANLNDMASDNRYRSIDCIRIGVIFINCQLNREDAARFNLFPKQAANDLEALRSCLQCRRNLRRTNSSARDV